MTVLENRREWKHCSSLLLSGLNEETPQMLVQAHVSIFFCQGFYNLIFSIEVFKQLQVVICLSLAGAYGVRGKSKYFFFSKFQYH